MDELSTRNVIITAALPYANSDIHLGGIASTYLPPDILYRYFKLKGRRAVQVCASDDFGTPILIAAEKAGKKPAEYVAEWNKKFKDVLERLGIVYDLFDRTSSPENVALVQHFFRKLNENGYIFSSDVSQFYCETDKKFLPDRYVKGKCPYCGALDQYSDGCENCGRTLQAGQILDPHCSICGRPPLLKSSNHYFFRLSAFSEKLKQWLNQNKNLQSDAKNYVLSWIRDGLQDWDITRDIDWGVPIPFEEAKGKVLYGWFDNHLCYIATALKVAGLKGKRGTDYWNDSEVYHFIGKDIVYHHYLFLPSMRLGEGEYRLPDFLPTRGHLLLEGKKISKSRHWMIAVKDFLEVFPADYLRFYLTRIVPYSQSDADFDWEEFRDKINNELVASIGNFAYRALVFVRDKHEGVVPEPAAVGKDERALEAELRLAVEQTGKLIDQGHYDRGLKRILELSGRCNQYFQKKEPWKKGADEPTTIYYSANAVASLAVLLQPFLPASSERLWRQLGQGGSPIEASWASASEFRIKPGTKLGRLEPLFVRVEEKDLDAARKKVV